MVDPSLIRLCKFNPSQTQNEQDADQCWYTIQRPKNSYIVIQMHKVREAVSAEGAPNSRYIEDHCRVKSDKGGIPMFC
jgi:hypothetical protein